MANDMGRLTGGGGFDRWAIDLDSLTNDINRAWVFAKVNQVGT